MKITRNHFFPPPFFFGEEGGNYSPCPPSPPKTTPNNQKQRTKIHKHTYRAAKKKTAQPIAEMVTEIENQKRKASGGISVGVARGP